LVEHQQSTSLELVGEQVWRGAFFLADYILHCAQTGTPSEPGNGEDSDKEIIDQNAENLITNDQKTKITNDQMVNITKCKVLELASGVGVTSIVAGMVANDVIVTGSCGRNKRT